MKNTRLLQLTALCLTSWSLAALQAHAECDMGKERLVLQQPGLPIQPFYGHCGPGPGETLGQGNLRSSTEMK